MADSKHHIPFSNALQDEEECEEMVTRTFWVDSLALFGIQLSMSMDGYYSLGERLADKGASFFERSVQHTMTGDDWKALLMTVGLAAGVSFGAGFGLSRLTRYAYRTSDSAKKALIKYSHWTYGWMQIPGSVIGSLIPVFKWEAHAPLITTHGQRVPHWTFWAFPMVRDAPPFGRYLGTMFVTSVGLIVLFGCVGYGVGRVANVGVNFYKKNMKH